MQHFSFFSLDGMEKRRDIYKNMKVVQKTSQVHDKN